MRVQFTYVGLMPELSDRLPLHASMEAIPREGDTVAVPLKDITDPAVRSSEEDSFIVRTSSPSAPGRAAFSDSWLFAWFEWVDR